MISETTPHTIQQIDPISSALSSLSTSSRSSLVASLDEMVRKDLEAFRAVLFWCLVAATVAVVVGVILEEAQEWMPTVEKILRLDPIVEYRWAKKLVNLGWILIVVGVAGEGIFEVYVSRAGLHSQCVRQYFAY
jgi:cation transporter-like permease